MTLCMTKITIYCYEWHCERQKGSQYCERQTALLIKAHAQVGFFFLNATAFFNQITGDCSLTVWTVLLTSIQPIPCDIKNAVALRKKTPCEWVLSWTVGLLVFQDVAFLARTKHSDQDYDSVPDVAQEMLLYATDNKRWLDISKEFRTDIFNIKSSVWVD